MNIKIIEINLENQLISAEFHSKELTREYPIIQWIPKKEKINVSILKPDGSLSKGYGEINLLNIPMEKTTISPSNVIGAFLLCRPKHNNAVMISRRVTMPHQDSAGTGSNDISWTVILV